jgi:hypothetical protein
MRRYVPNPAWADKIILENMADIEATMGKELAPIPSAGNPEVWSALGCGSYGCVYATSNPGIVMKLTDDESEAAFVASCLRDKIPWATGITEYIAIYRLTTNRKYPYYALWREAAEHIGEFRSGAALPLAMPAQTGQFGGLVPRAVARQPRHATEGDVPWLAEKPTQAEIEAVRSPIQSIQWNLGRAPAGAEFDRFMEHTMDEERRGVPPVARHSVIGLYVAEAKQAMADLSNVPGWKYVSDAMLYYADIGMLLGDVHTNNVGYCPRGGVPTLVIIDPGVMAPLRWRYLQVPIAGISDQYHLPPMLANARKASAQYTLYDYDSGERLRLATAEEVNAFAVEEDKEDRPAHLYDGTNYGFAGKRVWIDLTQPTIVGWSSEGAPIFPHFEYTVTTASGIDSLTNGRVAARFERDIESGRVRIDDEGYVAGGRYGFPGDRISIAIPCDEPALPPLAIQARWHKEWVAAQQAQPNRRSTGMSPEDFDPEQLAIGTEIELEHADDPLDPAERDMAMHIAMDHLAERPDYYEIVRKVGL